MTTPTRLPICPLSIPILTCKEPVNTISSPIDATLSIPILLQPPINRRSIKIQDIFAQDNSLCLVDEFLRDEFPKGLLATHQLQNDIVLVAFSIYTLPSTEIKEKVSQPAGVT